MIQALEMNLVSESQNDSRLKSVSLLTGSAIVVFVGLLFAIPSFLFTLGFSLSRPAPSISEHLVDCVNGLLETACSSTASFG